MKYIIEARDDNGNLLFGGDSQEVVDKYPEFFSRREWSIDQLCWTVSFAGGRDKPTGPGGLDKFFKSRPGLTYRIKTW
jgi:hypothetical protein